MHSKTIHDKSRDWLVANYNMHHSRRYYPLSFPLYTRLQFSLVFLLRFFLSPIYLDIFSIFRKQIFQDSNKAFFSHCPTFSYLPPIHMENSMIHTKSKAAVTVQPQVIYSLIYYLKNFIDITTYKCYNGRKTFIHIVLLYPHKYFICPGISPALPINFKI